MKKLSLGLLAKELLLVAPILLLGLWAGARYYAALEIQKVSTGYSIPWFLISFVIAVTLILVIIKFVKHKLPFQILMSLSIFIGSVVVLEAFMPSLYAFITVAALIVLYWVARNIMVHNLVIILTIAGIATYLGLMLPVLAILILLCVISIYDFIAVFKTKHMVRMFKSMADKGATMALIIPKTSGAVKKKVGKLSLKKGKREAVFLGTGDAAFPTMLAVAALQVGLYPALGVVVGALVGVAAVHFTLIRMKKPLPALPPIAAMSALGYLVGVLI